jgi:hypothetical protein
MGHGPWEILCFYCCLDFIDCLQSRKKLYDLPNAHAVDFHYAAPSSTLLTVKRARGKVSFDSQNVKCASKLSCYASPESYLSHLTSRTTNALFIFLSDKYCMPQEKHHWIVVKHICQFVSQMILYRGPLLQCCVFSIL